MQYDTSSRYGNLPYLAAFSPIAYCDYVVRYPSGPWQNRSRAQAALRAAYGRHPPPARLVVCPRRPRHKRRGRP